jgi:hypothetical protein
MIQLFYLGLDMMDPNISGFADSPISMDMVIDDPNLMKTKLTTAANKDKKKTFFKKVKFRVQQ